MEFSILIWRIFLDNSFSAASFAQANWAQLGVSLVVMKLSAAHSTHELPRFLARFLPSSWIISDQRKLLKFIYTYSQYCVSWWPWSFSTEHLFARKFQDSCASALNTLRTRQNDRHFADSFQCIFLNGNFWILNKISLKYVPYGLIDSMTALVQIMAWCQTSDKPLSEEKSVWFTDAYMHHSASMR